MCSLEVQSKTILYHPLGGAGVLDSVSTRPASRWRFQLCSFSVDLFVDKTRVTAGIREGFPRVRASTLFTPGWVDGGVSSSGVGCIRPSPCSIEDPSPISRQFEHSPSLLGGAVTGRRPGGECLNGVCIEDVSPIWQDSVLYCQPRFRDLRVGSRRCVIRDLGCKYRVSSRGDGKLCGN